jgi:glycosyltransferase involved in cell wall biosynthesis
MEFIILVTGVLSRKSFSGQIPFIVETGKALLAGGCRLTMVTSKVGEELFRSLGLDIDYRLIDRGEGDRNPGLMSVPFIMIKRMIKAGRLLRNKRLNPGTVIYANCNLLWEVFPLLLVKDRTAIRVSTFIMGYPSPFRGYRGAFTGKLKVPGLRETLAYLQYRLALPCLKRASDLVLAYPHMRDFLLSEGIPAEKIVKLEVGVRWSVLNTVPPSESHYTACWIGRYNPQKGCEDLITIWEKVAGEAGDARLAVMGDVAKELGPLSRKEVRGKNIEFLGPVSEEIKYSVMKGSEIFLFPSYYEAWPQTAQEAMACGLPVVAYDLPVYRHVFPRGMVTVAIGDKEAFAREVINILHDRSRRERLAAEAFSVASQYRWEKTAERLITATERLKNRLSPPE